MLNKLFAAPALVGIRPNLARPLLVLVYVISFSDVGAAQFGQYTTPGVSSGGGALGASGDLGAVGGGGKEAIEREMEEARWQFGGLRMAPFLGLRRVTFNNNVFGTEQNEVSDVQASFGAGFDAFLPNGSNVFWTAQVQPEYVAWRDLSERNQLIGRYGLGVAGYWNRLSLELRAARYETEQIVTPEFAQPVTDLQELLLGAARVKLSGAFSLFLSASTTDISDQSESAGDPRVPDFPRLGRREDRTSAGIVWALRENVELGLLYERNQVDFARDARNLSVDGDGPVLFFKGEGNRFGFDIRLTRHSLEPRQGSDFPARDENGGQVELRFDLASSFVLRLRAVRTQLFALDDRFTDITHERYRAELTTRFGDRTALLTFLEVGDDTFQGFGGASGRVDDAVSWGALMAVPLPRALPDNLRLQAGWVEHRLDSNQPGMDRTFGGPQLSLAIQIGSRLMWE